MNVMQSLRPSQICMSLLAFACSSSFDRYALPCSKKRISLSTGSANLSYAVSMSPNGALNTPIPV